VVQFDPSHYPTRLSAWGILAVRHDTLRLGRNVLPYDLNTPLFTDYAHKLRTVWLPPGTTAEYHPRDSFQFPVGSVLSKTFYYPLAMSTGNTPGQDPVLLRNEDYSHDLNGSMLNLNRVHLVETRLLIKQSTGWDALPYVWDAQQQDAILEIAGDLKQIRLLDPEVNTVQPLNYIIPTRDECAGCHASDHTSGKLLPIGPKARHLNKVYRHYAEGSAPQLTRWVEHGFLDNLPEQSAVPAAMLWQPNAFDHLQQRSRAYLDINCGHCHNARGAADTSGLFLDAGEQDPRRLGLCKPPVAAGKGSGNRRYSLVPGHPEQSILSFRMASTDPGEMMPELGRTSVHQAGLALIRTWIQKMPGNCD